jgi:uncharacterized membrane protein YebE (DUF533 family)
LIIAQQAAKDTGYSIIVVAGIAALGGLCYLMVRELYSRETPNGIYKEASKMCLANTEVNYTKREIFRLIMICFIGARCIRYTDYGSYNTTNWFNAYQ